jgi:hypothetical protein
MTPTQEPLVVLTPEAIANGCRYCTQDEMAQMPKLFENLGICNAEGELLVSPEPEAD